MAHPADSGHFTIAITRLRRSPQAPPKTRWQAPSPESSTRHAIAGHGIPDSPTPVTLHHISVPLRAVRICEIARAGVCG